MDDTTQLVRAASKCGLTMEEFDLAIEILGRPLTKVELGLFSAMWSEHCSYKSSKIHLGKFPTDGPQVIEGPGENAGVVDIGDGDAVVFKMESHNHPSFIEPYQGAATGVGGILRDIFTMGARPVASLNLLRFGSQDNARTKYLLDGVVSGIAGYGNCIGVPTIGGELSFNKSFNGNCLVNVFNLGVVKIEKIFLGKAEGVGNPVIYAGSATGRDGIHGATMASEEFSEATEAKRPTVQVGDPFTEKLLLEACLELFKTDYIVGIQDMGAAGMTSSSFEMAGRAGTGVEINLDKVPRREEGMTPYEIMLSESQERMLLVCRPGTEEAVKGIFTKWGLCSEVIGEVTGDGQVRLTENGKIVADVPALRLAQMAPHFSRLSLPPLNIEEVQTFTRVPAPENYCKTLQTLLASPNICSRQWVYRQYDHMVRTDTVVKPGSDASVIRIKSSGKGIAMSVDCNSRYCYIDPYMGGMQAVAEATRNVACSGAKPLAITDCLNFGSPENPEVMWRFINSIEGISKACLKLDTPVVSGNVSFYNQTGETPIYPTPAIGAVGLLADSSKAVTQFFATEGDIIILLGATFDEIGGSEYLSVIHGQERGGPPGVNLAKELALQKLMIALADERLVNSMHDISDGGVGVALAESAFSSENPGILGFDVSFTTELSPDRFLFSESQARAVASCRPDLAGKIIEMAKKNGTPARMVGEVTFKKVNIRVNSIDLVTTNIDELLQPWKEALGSYMSR